MKNKLKDFRIEKSLTQEQVAERLGVAVSTYNQLENNKRKVSLQKAKFFADLFNTTIEKLFF